MRQRFALLIFIAIVASAPAVAQDCSPNQYSSGVFGIGTSIAVSPGSGWGSVCAACNITTGMEYWGVCGGQGTAFPNLNYQASSGVPVTVNFYPGQSTNTEAGCGAIESWTFTTEGQLTGAIIAVYEQTSLGTPCEPYSDTIAHELGHILGMTNAPTACNGTGAIMSARIPYYDSNNNIHMGTRSVAADDCEAADEMWWVNNFESDPPCTARDCTPPPPPDPWCDAYCWTSCDSYGCPNPPPCSCSPIVLDLDDNGFTFTGPDESVSFDIDADGIDNRITWTSSRGRDAFLVLDRNANGMIDDGAELFGTSTRLANGNRAPNGYVALAEFDISTMGGNGNGVIDAGDSIWSELYLWVDADHDGTSDEPELLSLAAAGVIEIGTKYTRSNRSDKYGNLFRFKAKTIVRDKHGRAHSANTYDVIFKMSD